MDEYSFQAATTLTEVAARNTYEWVTTKRRQARENKDAKEQKETYEEIIETLLQEKTDLQNAAHQYKNLYEQITIEDKDIQYLKATIERVFELLSPKEEDAENEDELEKIRKDRENFEMAIGVIDIDTLKTMQLLGFNYKEAIGQPLTRACAGLIYNKLGGIPPQE